MLHSRLLTWATRFWNQRRCSRESATALSSHGILWYSLKDSIKKRGVGENCPFSIKFIKSLQSLLVLVQNATCRCCSHIPELKLRWWQDQENGVATATSHIFKARSQGSSWTDTECQPTHNSVALSTMNFDNTDFCQETSYPLLLVVPAQRLVWI